jgi:hypothetical protein
LPHLEQAPCETSQAFISISPAALDFGKQISGSSISYIPAIYNVPKWNNDLSHVVMAADEVEVVESKLNGAIAERHPHHFAVWRKHIVFFSFT